MENQIVVKTEVQPNGDILLFYVDGKNKDITKIMYIKISRLSFI